MCVCGVLVEIVVLLYLTLLTRGDVFRPENIFILIFEVIIEVYIYTQNIN